MYAYVNTYARQVYDALAEDLKQRVKLNTYRLRQQNKLLTTIGAEHTPAHSRADVPTH
jgi:hypothetical protein